ncbi:MAG: aminotransferase class III-fold pyridoxal phosphate-dependent enzyme [Candidatus Heimdallarchaeota archaeon]|nr:aminotransferase class III-fold pyridoxal phosphate-dependent enzyme [Candidatus Heimdallarchaeota archaeon]
MNSEELARKNKEFTLASWKAQATWNPITTVRAEGVYFYGANGEKYLDWASQLINVNIGHGNEKVIKAIQDQAAKLCYVAPSVATEPRARLGELLNEVTPAGLSKSFFTTAGTDAVENAIKIARLYTGRRKIVTRYRSYHGATAGSMTAGGDPRRLANEPGIEGIVRMHGADPLRSPIYKGRTAEEGDAIIADLLEQTINFEGPQYVAAILLEGYSGTSGIYQPGTTFWNRVQEICDKYGILLIIDEVMSGFGRTGKWFGIDHYPNVKPDMMCLAKGINSGYVPLGAVVVSDKIADHFENNVLWAGLTYSSHALACAAGVATIEYMKETNLVEKAAEMGKFLRRELDKLNEKHKSVAEIRGEGMHQIIDLGYTNGEPLSPFNAPPTEPMQKVAKVLTDNNLMTFVKWNTIYCCPPLIITEEQIMDAVAILDKALDEADKFV